MKTVAADEPYIAILSALDIPDAVLNTCGGRTNGNSAYFTIVQDIESLTVTNEERLAHGEDGLGYFDGWIDLSESVVASIETVDAALGCGVECAMCIKSEREGKVGSLCLLRKRKREKVTSVIAAHTVIGGYPHLSRRCAEKPS